VRVRVQVTVDLPISTMSSVDNRMQLVVNVIISTSGQTAIDRLQRENEDSSWQSVLDLYDSQIGVSNPLISELRLKPNCDSILPSIHSLLSSNRSDDDVSAELVDILGFDDIELVMQIVSSRPSLVHEMEQLLTIPALHDDSLHVQLRMEQKLRANAARPLFSGTAIPEPERLPHVYTSSSMSQGNILSHTGSKYLLPIGTDRKVYEQKAVFLMSPVQLLPKLTFILFRSAPTGASSRSTSGVIFGLTGVGDSIDRDAFKIIYVAPMKALASEIVQKFEKRLKWLLIKVRELQ
ncbi:hypothetical protein MPER_10991, partial [Moniliophthora perniciosa FA553]